MTQEFIGSQVSMDCGDVMGTYQGQVTAVDQATQSVTITKAFRNGNQCSVPQITINAADIHDLKILNTVEELKKLTFKDKHVTVTKVVSQGAGRPSNVSPRDPPSSNNNALKAEPTIHRSKSSNGSLEMVTNQRQKTSPQNSPRSSPHAENFKKGGRVQSPRHQTYLHGNRSPVKNLTTSVSNGYSCATSLMAGNRPRHHMENGPGVYQPQNHNSVPPRQQNGDAHGRHRNNSLSDSQVVKTSGSTPRKMDTWGRKAGREDCFSAPVDMYLDEEFDFEKNLAMFDKQAVFEEIENLGYPRIVRPEDRSEAKFRCDENVLQSKPAAFKQIRVPVTQGVTKEYVTDTGLVVPCIPYELRTKVLSAAQGLGLSLERQVEIVGRSAAEMVLQLIGGCHRLNPQNAHQQPSVVVLCGPHVQGAQAMNCARHLAMHNVQVTTFLPDLPSPLPDLLKTELNLHQLTGARQTSNPTDLPAAPVDIIINALDTHQRKGTREQAWHKELVTWANHNKAPALAMDPPTEGGAIDTKWSLGIGLPLSMAEKCGQVYLCDLSIPRKVYQDLGITYKSPFSHKFVIPLHTS